MFQKKSTINLYDNQPDPVGVYGSQAPDVATADVEVPDVEVPDVEVLNVVVPNVAATSTLPFELRC